MQLLFQIRKEQEVKKNTSLNILSKKILHQILEVAKKTI